MGWLSILLAIVQAIPTIIKVVQMIRELLKTKTSEEKAAYGARLRGILQRYRVHRCPKTAADELEGVLKDLK